MNKIKLLSNKTENIIVKYPFITFGILLITLLGLIIMGNLVRSGKIENEQEQQLIKEIKPYYIGTQPSVDISGNIKKSGVVKIYAQTSGVVNAIYASNGSQKTAGQWIIGLSSNYSGGNALVTQKQLAQKQYEIQKQTYPIQMEIIEEQIKLANKNDAKLDELRDIASRSKDQTQEVLEINEEILQQLEQTIGTLEENNVGGSNDALILSNKQLLSQYKSAISANKTAISNFELQENNSIDKTLNAIQKRTTLLQLENQQKSLEIGLEISELQLRLAQINESLMYPSMPFAGTVEKINVKIGDLVNPGDVIATIDSNENNLTLEVLTTKEQTQKISKTIPSKIQIEGENIELLPTYISSEATEGNLYSVFYDLPNGLDNKLTENQSIAVSIPVGYPDSSANIAYMPIDAVHQTQSGSFIYVVEEDKAISKEVVLGNITGDFVEITEGLSNEDIVILDRNIVDGDQVNILE